MDVAKLVIKEDDDSIDVSIDANIGPDEEPASIPVILVSALAIKLKDINFVNELISFINDLPD